MCKDYARYQISWKLLAVVDPQLGGLWHRFYILLLRGFAIFLPLERGEPLARTFFPDPHSCTHTSSSGFWSFTSCFPPLGSSGSWAAWEGGTKSPNSPSLCPSNDIMCVHSKWWLEPEARVPLLCASQSWVPMSLESMQDARGPGNHM